jgi:phosphatidylethanolamine N-methyltransferase
VAALQNNVDDFFNRTGDWFEEFILQMRSKISSDYVTLVNDSKSLFNPAKLQLTREAKDLNGLDRNLYSLVVEGTPTSGLAWLDRRSGREGEDARSPPIRSGDAHYRPLILEYGAPIKVRWTAPKSHGTKDWIGLYMVSDTIEREVTRVSSRGRWVAVAKGQYDSVRADAGILTSNEPVVDNLSEHDELVTGEVVFTSDKLWWTTGVFEFRYHHDGKHTVMAISHPFEIRVGKFDEDDVELDLGGHLAPGGNSEPIRRAVEQALLPVVRNCFDRDPDIAPSTVDESFGSLVERDGKFSRRVVFAVSHMFGIEFAPEVVQADGNVRNLAWRICNAKKVLVSYYDSLRSLVASY